METRKVAMIFLDAFSSRYIDEDDSPYICEMFREGYGKFVEPLFAFEGIGATIFSGTWPCTNNVWTNFIKKDNVGNDITDLLMRSSFKILDLIPSDRMSSDSRYMLYRLLRKPVPIPNLVPSSLLRYFEDRLSQPIFSDSPLNDIPTLFDILKRNRRTVKILAGSGLVGDDRIADMVVKYFRRKDISSLTYFKLSSLDAIGHRHGPRSQEARSAVRKIDKQLKRMIEEGRRAERSLVFLVFSDHGMTPVSKEVNMFELIRGTGLRICSDFIFFLDSTIARFWFFNRKAHDVIESLLSDTSCGRILSDSDLQEMRLPVNRNQYGEIIFALNEGTLVKPDFFHKKETIRGMHGYCASSYDYPILSILPPDGIHIPKGKSVEFIDIMPTALHLLGLSRPPTCEGRSIIKGF